MSTTFFKVHSQFGFFNKNQFNYDSNLEPPPCEVLSPQSAFWTIPVRDLGCDPQRDPRVAKPSNSGRPHGFSIVEPKPYWTQLATKTAMFTMFDRVATSIIVLLLVTAIWCVRNALEETSAASGWHRDDHLKLCSHWVMGCLKIGYPNIWWLYKFPHSLNNGDLGVKPCKNPYFQTRPHAFLMT